MPNAKFTARVHSMDTVVPPSIGSKMYAKNNTSFNSGNGVITNGNAAGAVAAAVVRNGKPLLHQNSFINGGPVPPILTVVVDPDKLEAAKKRREENAEKEQAAQVKKPKTSWKQRLKWLITTTLSLTAILSGSSLLFIIPLAVDPILHGFEAQFYSEPVFCRTSSSEYAYGTAHCEAPSCREGCTADVYNCTYIYVSYTKDLTWSQWSSKSRNRDRDRSRTAIGVSASASGDSSAPPFEDDVPLISTNYNYNYTNNSTFNISSPLLGIDTTNEIDSSSSPPLDFDVDSIVISDLDGDNLTFSNATLFVNPTGCGYPPEINCSVFDETYMNPGSIYPCYYSQSEDSIVVPYYNWGDEFLWLSFILGFPLSTLLASSMLLCVVFRWKVDPIPSGPEEFSDAGASGDKASVENGGYSRRNSFSRNHKKDKWAHHHNHNNHNNHTHAAAAHGKSKPGQNHDDSSHAHAETTLEVGAGAANADSIMNPSTSSSFKANGHGPPKSTVTVSTAPPFVPVPAALAPISISKPERPAPAASSPFPPIGSSPSSVSTPQPQSHPESSPSPALTPTPVPEEPKPSTSGTSRFLQRSTTLPQNVIPFAMIAQSSSFTSSTDSAVT